MSAPVPAWLRGCFERASRDTLADMAGGMRSRNVTPIPMHMRGRAGPATDVVMPTSSPAPRRRHCWVQLPAGAVVEGLAVEWARHERGWQALVTYVDGEQLVTRWAPAGALRQA